MATPKTGTLLVSQEVCLSHQQLQQVRRISAKPQTVLYEELTRCRVPWENKKGKRKADETG